MPVASQEATPHAGRRILTHVLSVFWDGLDIFASCLLVIAMFAPHASPRVHLAEFSPDGRRSEPFPGRPGRNEATAQEGPARRERGFRTPGRRSRWGFDTPPSGSLRPSTATPRDVVGWGLAPRFVDGLFSVWPACTGSAPLSLHLTTPGHAKEDACTRSRPIAART